MGLAPIRPVVEELTGLPVVVLNSHTHYDHMGGNAEFETILALDSDYGRHNAAGWDHDTVSGELDPRPSAPRSYPASTRRHSGSGPSGRPASSRTAT